MTANEACFHSGVDWEAMTNPLLIPSQLPYELPPFADIRVEHYRPAFTEALSRHRAEIAAITDNPDAPTWTNTIEVLERSGRDLERVMAVFGNLSGTDITDEMEEIAAEVYPQLSAHRMRSIKMTSSMSACRQSRRRRIRNRSVCMNTCCAYSSARAQTLRQMKSSVYPRSTSVYPHCRKHLAAT